MADLREMLDMRRAEKALLKSREQRRNKMDGGVPGPAPAIRKREDRILSDAKQVKRPAPASANIEEVQQQVPRTTAYIYAKQLLDGRGQFGQVDVSPSGARVKSDAWRTLSQPEREEFKRLLTADRKLVGVTEENFVINALPPVGSRQWRRLIKRPGFEDIGEVTPYKDRIAGGGAAAP